MSKDKRAPYVRGYDQGEQDARRLLVRGEPRALLLPVKFQDRCEYLDGYTCGMRRVVLDARLAAGREPEVRCIEHSMTGPEPSGN